MRRGGTRSGELYISAVSTKRARISTDGVAPYPSSSSKLDLKGDCTRSSRSSAVGCWGKNVWARKNDRRLMYHSACARPGNSTTTMLDADAKIFALTTATAGSCTARGTLATAVPTAQREAGAGAKTSGLAKRTASSCTAVPVLAAAAGTILLGADETLSAVATATTGACIVVGTLAAAVTTLRGADAEVLRSQQRRQAHVQ